MSHRVAQIQEIIDLQAWRHILSEDNPADALSRGQLPQAFLNNQLWFSGPSWLTQEEGEWPKGIVELKEIPELRKNMCLATVSNDCSFLKKYSSYSQLLKITALPTFSIKESLSRATRHNRNK